MRLAFTFNRAAPCLLLSLLSLLVLLISEEALAQPEASEDELKAAFLYHFADYITWPPTRFDTEVDPIVFGVLNADALARDLEQLSRERRVRGRPIAVRQLKGGDEVADLHVLFIAGPHPAETASMLEQGLMNAVLTVTEATGDRPRDSVINFEVVDEMVRFDVSLPAAQAARLGVSSRLLQVALRVIE